MILDPFAGRLSKMADDYYADGGGDEITLRENRVVVNRLKIPPCYLADVKGRDILKHVLLKRNDYACIDSSNWVPSRGWTVRYGAGVY